MKRAVFWLASLTAIAASAVGLLTAKLDRRGDSAFRMGVPDDTGGLAVRYALKKMGISNVEVRDGGLKLHSFKDCCSSSSEWALGSKRVDAAVMCPSAAGRLVERNPGYETIGPVVVNSDVLVLRRGRSPKSIGAPWKRHYGESALKERFGSGCAVLPMIPSGLPYAFERGTVDGVVVDVLKAFGMSGEISSIGEGGADVVTYALVAERGFASGRAFKSFLKAYENAASELSDIRSLARAVEDLKGIRLSSREAEEWKRLKVRFVSPRSPGFRPEEAD